ncbi:HAD-IA family hydrolase [Enterococcus nangangensis]|uniref:HAD-IA family hydrolase n=1 Tax=Enterococcus nangangensis TaxID=2559926 RepID=UPI0010F54A3E|nr:HAD-IA family hydrolase [Enterococcus nangangensis]
MISFIWDLDGTLVDSYEVILQSLAEAFDFFHLDFDYTSVKQIILEQSVVYFLTETALKNNLSYDLLKNYFSKLNKAKVDELTLMVGAEEVLTWTKEKGIQNFIYTHKSATALTLLKKLNIDHYFAEVITSAAGFQRKPHPEAIDYLITKYRLKREETYYIGDRPLDHQVALNSKIQSVNLAVKNSENNSAIDKLADIMDLF